MTQFSIIYKVFFQQAHTRGLSRQFESNKTLNNVSFLPSFFGFKISYCLTSYTRLTFKILL